MGAEKSARMTRVYLSSSSASRLRKAVKASLPRRASTHIAFGWPVGSIVIHWEDMYWALMLNCSHG